MKGSAPRPRAIPLHRSDGVSILEIAIATAVLGILMSVGVGFLPTDRLQVQQAARGFSGAVQYARTEAITQNRFAGIHVHAGGFLVFADLDGDLAYSAADRVLRETSVGGAASDFPGVRLGVPTGTLDTVFDPRGIVVGAPNQRTKFRSARDAEYAWEAIVSLQGRVRLETP